MYSIIDAGTNCQPMFELSQDAGWNQTLAGLQLLSSRFPQYNHLAVSSDRGVEAPVGSSMVLPIGKSVAWIGMVLIHPDHRRKGLATSLTEICTQKARLDMGKSVVGLDATPAGSRVYDRIGFKPSFRIWRSTLETNHLTKHTAGYSIFPANRLADCLHLYSPDKLNGLKLIYDLHPEGSWVVKDNEQTLGIVMTRPGRLKPFIGPLLASTPSVAQALLNQALEYWKKLGYNEVFIDIPEIHFNTASQWKNNLECTAVAREFMINTRVVAKRSLIRMYEVVTEEVLQELTERTQSTDTFKRNSKALEMAIINQDQTLKFMQSELDRLPYTYATGGPELG